jgi:hypothetical protein
MSAGLFVSLSSQFVLAWFGLGLPVAALLALMFPQVLGTLWPLCFAFTYIWFESYALIRFSASSRKDVARG